jgi:hypothetical protein
MSRNLSLVAALCVALWGASAHGQKKLLSAAHIDLGPFWEAIHVGTPSPRVARGLRLLAKLNPAAVPDLARKAAFVGAYNWVRHGNLPDQELKAIHNAVSIVGAPRPASAELKHRLGLIDYGAKGHWAPFGPPGKITYHGTGRNALASVGPSGTYLDTPQVHTFAVNGTNEVFDAVVAQRQRNKPASSVVLVPTR